MREMDVRERLLQAALRVFRDGGSRAATTRRIAREAGVNEITLFRHFGTKGALLSEALQAAAREDLVDRLPAEPADPEAELTAWSRTLLAHLRRAASMIRACLGEVDAAPGMRPCAGTTAGRELAEYVGRLRERGLADPETDPAPAAALLMGALFSDAMRRDVTAERFGFGPEEAPEKYVTLFLRAIGASRARPAPRGRRAVRTPAQALI
jgi:AcrR family transcriptional regulator